MDIEQLFLTRQSCRNFQDKPVDDETLRKIAELAHLAPSSVNAQPWKVYAATGEKAKEVARALQGMGMNKFTEKCPAFFAITEGKASFTAKVAGAKHLVPYDVGIFAAHIVLAAQALGVGSCIIGWRNEKTLQRVLGLKDKQCIPLVIALGYPAENDPLRQKRRKPLDEVFEII